MKYMSWSWKEYSETPQYVVDEVIDIMVKEQEELERIRNR